MQGGSWFDQHEQFESMVWEKYEQTICDVNYSH